MIIYVLCTLPWQLGVLYTSPKNHTSVKRRKFLTALFFGTLPPMIYYFVQHKVHRIPGGELRLINYYISILIILSIFSVYDIRSI